MGFKEYLAIKKIDSNAYKAAEPKQWSEFATIFSQMHPKSFTMQKLNLINGIRREYPYIQVAVEPEQVKSITARPVIKPKTSLVSATSGETKKKPVMKPKISSAGIPKMGKPVMKPKMGKPVMKPKMNTDQGEENKEATKPKPVMKPKMVRPVIKPKNKE